MTKTGKTDAPVVDARHPSETSAAAPPPSPPTRLTDYLTSSTAQPKAFLAGLVAAGIERLEPEDEERALTAILERPALTRRLAELVHAAVRSRSNRKRRKVADAVVRVGGRAARRLAQRAFALEGEGLDELRPMTMALAEKVGNAGAAGALEGLEPFDLLKLWIWHAHERGLGLDDIVEAARKLNGGHAADRGLDPDKAAVVELLFAPKAQRPQLPKLLALTTPALSLAQERAAEIDRLRARCATLERSRADTEAKWKDLRGHADEQATALAAAERRAEQLGRDVLDERAAHGHRLRNARGGFIKFLTKDIGPRLENALAALVDTPPHLDVTEDRLRSVSSLIGAQARELQDAAG